VAPAFVASGAIVLISHLRLNWRRFALGGGLALLAVSGLCSLANGAPTASAPSASIRDAGGYLGVVCGTSLSKLIGTVGAVVVLVGVLVAAVVLATGIGLTSLFRSTVSGWTWLRDLLSTWFSTTTVRGPEGLEPLDVQTGSALLGKESKKQLDVAEATIYDQDADLRRVTSVTGLPQTSVGAATVPGEEGAEVLGIDAKKEKKKGAKPAAASTSGWTLPSLSLLKRSQEHRHDEQQIAQAGDELVRALLTHGVETTLIGWTVGPTVTRYELELGPGVKVARITSLNRDIAYAMASPDVRILAPIPGRQAIGIEVPNRQRQLVALGDILASNEAAQAHHPLEVAIGRDISGKSVMVNLAEMPHILIAGSTGSGKSSCMNSLITSVLMRSTPDEVEMILIDPKRVELGQYNGLPHLKTPVVVDPKKAANALSWAVKEMERRYDLLAEYGLRDITGWNQAFDRGELVSPNRPDDAARLRSVAQSAHAAVHGEELFVDPAGDEPDDDAPKRMPFMLVIVDELNDLMMVAARDVEESIVRIAQMARAVGIHLVLATQRPSVNVVTGVIKANVPSRMAFSVSSLADSRVILDQSGAERLVGKGDMLLVTASSNIARRIQAPWVSEEEVRSVVAAWQRQGGIKNAWRGRRQQPGPLSQARPRGRALPSAIESLSYLGRAAVPLPGNADGPRPNASAAAHEGGHRRRPT
ncbi:MAG: DNA translocase FtsK, partial [Actinomycetota bacterium]